MATSLRRRARLRRAFTLVELLVVIAIIGVLVGLLLPAVQAAREAGRRAQCQNNLKQLGLAANSHMSTHGHMPTGGWGYLWVGDADRGHSTNQPGGWVYNLLPYVEQQNLHDVNRGQSDKTAANRNLMLPLPFMNCPTRRSAKLYPNPENASFVNAPKGLPGLPRSDYAANAGAAAAVIDKAGPRTLQGFPATELPPVHNGIVNERSMVKQAQIKDGLSNTMLFGEKYLEVTNYATGKNAGDNECMFTGHNKDIARVFGSTDTTRPRSDSNAVYSDGFGAAHSGVMYFVRCDGSTVGINYNIDLPTYILLGSRNDGLVIDSSKL